MNRKTSQKARVYHRYLGFFLTGIMAVYAISGVALIFRNTDYLKKEVSVTKQLEAQLDLASLEKELKIKNKESIIVRDSVITFDKGTYNLISGIARFDKMETPYVLDKLQHFHKAKTGQPLYYLNIFFGVALLFFVLSAFWMFMPATPIFKKGMYFAAAGLVVTLGLLFL